MKPRDYFPGVGQAVADRTVNRPGETWGDVAERVALGNTLLHPTGIEDVKDLRDAIAAGKILMSGRHLQHGDENQPDRNIEVFTNCSTASQRTILFYLLLNGSGVGTSYDDDMCILNWDNMPTVVPVIDADHADSKGNFLTLKEAVTECEYFKLDYEVFTVPDSREGWAEAVQKVENMTFEAQTDGVWRRRRQVLIVDFSELRPEGSPINGMQGRPSSGPVPLMRALDQMNQLPQKCWPLWRQAMWLDHVLAEIVLVGGARRAARIAVKWWEDTDILEFINIKSDGGMWTANNSVGVDERFWSMVNFVRKWGHFLTSEHEKAWKVFQAVTEAQYQHGTGEPGFLNLDLISRGEEGAPAPELDGRLALTESSKQLRSLLTEAASRKKYPVIVNPCGEIRLSVNGGYCVIADLAAAFCEEDGDLARAARLATRALIRTNLMPALYDGEVKRTNRIGVGLTGLHEYAWKKFGLTFYDLIEEGEDTIIDANGREMKAPADKAKTFWFNLAIAAAAVEDEAFNYSQELGVEMPLTRRTIKPAGTTSKLFGLTEGVHLPAMREYLRWVQFRDDSPLVAEYEAKGYPVRRDLQSYRGVTIVGFPTRLLISELMGPNVVTAAEASPAEQIRWLRLLETFWLLEEGGNQISYTLKYDPKALSLKDYQRFVAEEVPLVRAVSVMPQIDTTAYEYQPEEPITAHEYDQLMARIERGVQEDVGLEHTGCSTGACPVDWK